MHLHNVGWLLSFFLGLSLWFGRPLTENIIAFQMFDIIAIAMICVFFSDIILKNKIPSHVVFLAAPITMIILIIILSAMVEKLQ